MGYITNQWLKGVRQRRRGYGPVKVVVKGSLASDDWDKEHQMVAEISARRPSGNYQSMLVTQEELNQLVARVAGGCTMEIRLKLAASALDQLDDQSFILFLSNLLRDRTFAATGKA